jgi:hypothetical protein
VPRGVHCGLDVVGLAPRTTVDEYSLISGVATVDENVLEEAAIRFEYAVL